MTYNEVKSANAASLKAYAEYQGKQGPKLKLQIREVDFGEDLCLINGEWQNIKGVVVSIINRQICVTNIRVLSKWRGFEKDFVYYIADELNNPSNRVMFATASFYTEEGIEHMGKEYEEDGESFDIDDYVNMDYDDICSNMQSERVGDILVLMRIKTWQGVRYGYKVISPKNWGSIFSGYGCDDFAFYLDRFNLNFIGYHHDSDNTPNRGILREIKQGVELTDAQLDKIVKQFEKGESNPLLSKYTQSLRPHFTKVFGFK